MLLVSVSCILYVFEMLLSMCECYYVQASWIHMDVMDKSIANSADLVRLVFVWRWSHMKCICELYVVYMPSRCTWVYIVAISFYGWLPQHSTHLLYPQMMTVWKITSRFHCSVERILSTLAVPMTTSS